MSADDRLTELFQRWQQARREAQPLSVEELCHDCPELTQQLRQLIRVSQSPDSSQRTVADQLPLPPAFLDLAPGVEPVRGYHLVSLLGRGSFGQVWKATGPGGFTVAIKCVPLDGEADSSELRALELMKDIHHANLLALFGAWQSADMLIVSMELAEGSLLDRCNECRHEGLPGIPRPELHEYMMDAAKGIDFLNEPRHFLLGKEDVSIQHRDIKPQNLLLVGGSVKVADFGLAKLLEHSGGSNSGSMTAAYAAPECFKGKTSNRSDQYSLAVTYCQLRGGRLPFEGSHVGQIMLGHVGKPPDLSMLGAEEHGPIVRALAKDPEQRWPSCRAFVQALQQTTEKLPAGTASGSAAPVPPSSRSLATAPTVPPEPGSWIQNLTAQVNSATQEHGTAAWQGNAAPRRPGRVWAWVAALLGVGFMVGAGFVAVQHFFGPNDGSSSNSGPALVAASTTQATSVPGRPTPSEGTRPRTTTKVETPVTKKVETPTTKKVDKTPEQINKEKAAAADKKGLASLKQGELDQAIEQFGEALDLDPDNAVYSAHRGRAYLESKEYDKAIADFTKSIQRDNRNAAVYADRARAYADIKKYDKAISDFDESLQLEPKNAGVLASRGSTYAQRRDFDKALADFDLSIQLNDRSAPAFRNRGVVYAALGKPDEALADFNRAIAIDPTFALAYGSRARAYLQRKELDNAMRDCNTALKLDRKYWWAYNQRGYLYAQRHEWNKAIEDYSQAILLNDKFVTAYANRALAYKEIGKNKEAAADRSMVKKLEAQKGEER